MAAAGRVGRSDLEDLNDVGVLKPSYCLGLGLESIPCLTISNVARRVSEQRCG